MSKLLLKHQKKIVVNTLVKGLLIGTLAGCAHLLTLYYFKQKTKV
jgi:hypothetical protein